MGWRGPVPSGFFQQLVLGEVPIWWSAFTSHSGVSGAHPHSASFISSWVFVFSFSVRPQERVNHDVLITIISPECLLDFSLKFLVCCNEVIMDKGIWHQVG